MEVKTRKVGEKLFIDENLTIVKVEPIVETYLLDGLRSRIWTKCKRNLLAVAIDGLFIWASLHYGYNKTAVFYSFLCGVLFTIIVLDVIGEILKD